MTRRRCCAQNVADKQAQDQQAPAGPKAPAGAKQPQNDAPADPDQAVLDYLLGGESK